MFWTAQTYIEEGATDKALAEQQKIAGLDEKNKDLPNLSGAHFMMGELLCAEVRSLSRFGLSQVTVTFEDGTDIYLARQVVGERLATARLSAGVERPRLGPIATSARCSTTSSTATATAWPSCARCRTGASGRSSRRCAASPR